MTKEEWNKYKDLEYYPDRVCACGCGGKIKVRLSHKYDGIPKFIFGHHRKSRYYTAEVVEYWEQCKDLEYYLDRVCKCGCGERIRVQPHHKYYGIPKFIGGHQNKTDKAKEKNRQAHLKENLTEETIEKQRQASLIMWQDLEYKEKQHQVRFEKWQDPKYRERQLKARFEKWQDPEYRKKQLKAIFEGLRLLPNKPEKFLSNLFQELFQGEWRYVGDGQFIIAGKCPDFVNVNGQKKIIELYGDYWHRNDNPQDRIDLFAKYGYQTLIIWEHELEDIDKLTEKVLNFNGV